MDGESSLVACDSWLDAGYLMLDVWCSYLVKRKAEFVGILIYHLQLTVDDLELCS